MADNPLHHPDKDELVAFGLGKLQPDQATKIETHLEGVQFHFAYKKPRVYAGF